MLRQLSASNRLQDLPHDTGDKFIDLHPLLPGVARHPLLAHGLTLMESCLSITALNRVYTALAPLTEPAPFFADCVRRLRLRYTLVDQGLRHLPTTGPVIVVANHPFGGPEGIILGAILAGARPDSKCLGNQLLHDIPALRSWVIPVDPFGHRSTMPANGVGLKAALRWVRQGGSLLTFPAGEVSALHWHTAQVADPPWSPHVGALIRHTQATVVPIYVHGRNSALFQCLGLVHPRLRTLMLPHELLNKADRPVPVVVGEPLPWSALARFTDDALLMTHLRLVTYGLRARCASMAAPRRWRPRFLPHPKTQVAIAPPGDAQGPRQEVAALPAAQCLVEQGEFAVYLATAAQGPALLREIGRLREVTFRAIGERTGQASDLDTFDQHYTHLVLWHRAAGVVAGAYRLGCTDGIVPRYGLRGLYTTTLFRFKPQFFAHLGPAIELGRAFIRAEYQRHYGCLGMLWRGIATFLVRSPHYRYLFGPVSVSQAYNTMSRQALVQCLWEQKRDAVLASYVRPRHPYRRQSLAALDAPALHAYVRDFQNVTSLVETLDADKGIPVLLHYYLQLGATFLSFSVDKQFAHAIDGLILVDMRRATPTFLRRFMGRAGYAQFMASHDQPHG